jgi:hypothetical protein
MHNLQLAIQTNPLEATPIGAAVGLLAFDITLGAEFAANGHSNVGT